MKRHAFEPARHIADDCIACRVRIINRLVNGIYDDALRPHGVRISQLNILVTIAVRGPVRAADVCRILRIEKSTLSRDLERMVAKGWVQASPGTGRAQSLEATNSGRALIQAVTPDWEQGQMKVREALGTALISGIRENVNAMWSANADQP